MVSRVHKRFFREPTEATIRKHCDLRPTNPADWGLVHRLLRLEEGEALRIKGPLHPERYRDSRQFMLRANEVSASVPRRILDTVLRAVRDEDKPPAPLDFRRAAFGQIRHPYFAGYKFAPFPLDGLRQDSRVRRVSLVECLEGARIYRYTHSDINFVRPCDIGEYHDSRRVTTQGATVPVRVPSRTKGQRRYNIRLMGEPVRKNRHKHRLGAGVFTEGHDCARKLWHFRYRGEPGTDERGDRSSEGEFVFCAHEIAGKRQFMDTMWGNGERTPAVMSQFVQPSDLLIKIYRRTLDSVVIYDPSLASKSKLRKPNKADEEIILWMAVRAFGHDLTCYRLARDAGHPDRKPLREADWSLRYVA